MKNSKFKIQRGGSVQAFERAIIALIFCMALFAASAQERPVRQATDAEVAAKADVKAYINPRQLNGGGGGVTNGQTLPQVQATVANNAIAQTNGVGKGTVLTSAGITNSLSITNGSYLDLYMSNGTFLRTNTAPPFDWYLSATNGTSSQGTNTVTKFSVDASGNVLMLGPTTTNSGTFSLTGNGTNFSGAYFEAGINIMGGQITGNAAGATNIPFTAADSSWPSVTNYARLINPPPTSGQFAAFTGAKDAFGSYTFYPTNPPADGSTPNGLVTNASPVNITATGASLASTNGSILGTNSTTLTTFIADSVSGQVSTGTNGGQQIVLNPTTGASINTGTSNYFGGNTYVETNVTPWKTFSNATNSFSDNQLYTNGPYRGLLIGQLLLTTTTTGDANDTLFYTNSGVGYSKVFNKVATTIGTTLQWSTYMIPLSPGATFRFSPLNGTGAFTVVTNAQIVF